MKPATTVDQVTQRNVETIVKMEQANMAHRTPGERFADKFAEVIGSWRFIIIQSSIIGVWMLVNVLAWIKHWDPYPFIFLNLVLSFQSAYAGPILLMSQNRQSRMTELRDQLNLQVNLLAEQENTETLRLLRLLCEKHGLNISDDAPGMVLEQPTEPTTLAMQIELAEKDCA